MTVRTKIAFNVRYTGQHANHRRKWLIKQHRNGGGGIDFQKIRIPSPRRDFHEIDVNAVFGEHQSDEAGGGIELVVQKLGHEPIVLNAQPGRGTALQVTSTSDPLYSDHIEAPVGKSQHVFWSR